jgi:putative inorganic carbon (hco3(-)) transporter
MQPGKEPSAIRGGVYDGLLVYGTGILFVTINSLLIFRGYYLFSLIAVVPAIVYFALFSLNRLFMSVVFLTPLSVELSSLTRPMSFDVSLPTEPLIIVLMVMVLLRVAHRGTFNRKILYHPISLAVLFYLFWLLITTLTSTMPVISAKFLLVRFWFIIVFYFFALLLFSRHGNMKAFLWCYIAGLFIVIIYTFYNHAEYGFVSRRVSHLVVRPFYNDHTAYGAALAMFIPVLAVTFFRERKGAERWLALGMLAVFLGALVFSYSRAAWLSVIAAIIVWIIIRVKIGFIPFLSFILISAGLLFMLKDDIAREMEKNTQDSSVNLSEHLRSVTNITSDASNLERLNRWKTALAMHREKPLLGWGPGTYMFQYAPFQYSYDRTIISTNFGDGGDAHSEYLGPLSESGLPGMLSILLVAATALYTGFRLLRVLKKRKDRLLVTGILLGLVTYLSHGILNNFLHTDKAAVPFWGFAAILVAMDLYGKRRPASTGSEDLTGKGFT